jgi:hypothetical protein
MYIFKRGVVLNPLEVKMFTNSHRSKRNCATDTVTLL